MFEDLRFVDFSDAENDFVIGEVSEEIIKGVSF